MWRAKCLDEEDGGLTDRMLSQGGRSGGGESEFADRARCASCDRCNKFTDTTSTEKRTPDPLPRSPRTETQAPGARIPASLPATGMDARARDTPRRSAMPEKQRKRPVKKKKYQRVTSVHLANFCLLAIRNTVRPGSSQHFLKIRIKIDVISK